MTASTDVVGGSRAASLGDMVAPMTNNVCETRLSAPCQR